MTKQGNWGGEKGTRGTDESNFAIKIRARVAKVAGRLGVISVDRQARVIKKLSTENKADADVVDEAMIEKAFRDTP